MRRRWRSLRASLAWLLAAVILPLTAAGTAVLAFQWRQQRQGAVTQLQEHARALQRAIDREMALDQAVLSALAGSRDIDVRDWATFHSEAKKASEVRPGSWFVLYDSTGQTVVNTSVPFGTPLPNLLKLSSAREVEWEGRKLPLPDPGFIRAPFETGRSSFSGLMYGPVNKRPVVSNTVPVMREGKPRYVLGLGYSSEFLVNLLKTERGPADLRTAIFDRNGLIVARNRAPEKFVGLRAPDPFGEGGAGLPDEGVGENLSIERVRFVYAYSRAANGWIVAAGMPRSAVLAPAWRALWIWLAVLVSAGLVGSLLAFRLWRRIAIPLGALAHQARSLGDRQREVSPSDVEEVETLRVALQDTATNERIRQRTEAEREEAREELRLANERLVEADRRKDEFLSMLSHELRNPLGPIRTNAYILRIADPASPQAARARVVIDRQAEHLTRIVDDLLDVTRIGRGKILLNRERVDLRKIVSGVAEDAHQEIEKRGVTLRVALPPGEVWVDADATRLTQMLGNLLNNAAKFTTNGGEITVTLAEVAGSAEVTVRDTGAGIDPALLPSLFQPFVQGDRTLARTEGGLGLGLALVKGLAELHGGSVRARSEGVGRGAEFVVTLPLAARAGEAPTARAIPVRNGARRHVLVVDDNVDAADSLAQLVEAFGHDAEVAYDGQSGLEKARRRQPDVVLCDIGLPDMSGYDVARALRARHDGTVHLVAVSGYAQPEDVKNAIDAGFDEHVAKPPDPARIEKLLDATGFPADVGLSRV